MLRSTWTAQATVCLQGEGYKWLLFLPRLFTGWTWALYSKYYFVSLVLVSTGKGHSVFIAQSPLPLPFLLHMGINLSLLQSVSHQKNNLQFKVTFEETPLSQCFVCYMCSIHLNLFCPSSSSPLPTTDQAKNTWVASTVTGTVIYSTVQYYFNGTPPTSVTNHLQCSHSLSNKIKVFQRL